MLRGVRRLTAISHEEDPTRKVTAGFNQVDNAIRNRLVDEMDVAGFNYGAPRYSEILAAARPHSQLPPRPRYAGRMAKRRRRPGR
jgi:hypothetical protein